MSTPLTCPSCQTSLLGEPIPAKHQGYYGSATHFSRVIGHEVRGVYDGVWFWSCPDCGHEWPRFSEAAS